MKHQWSRDKFMQGMELIRNTLKKLRIGVAVDFPQMLVDHWGRPYVVDFDFARTYGDENRKNSEAEIDAVIGDTIQRFAPVLDARDERLGRTHVDACNRGVAG